MKFIEKISKIFIYELKTYFKNIKKFHKNAKAKKCYSKNVIKTNRFNNAKHRIILIKKKEFGFFERYEKCKDFIDSFRNNSIKFALKQKRIKLK